MAEKIVISEPMLYPEKALSILRNVGDIKSKRFERTELEREVQDATVLLVWIRDRVDRALIDIASRLKVIGTASAGVNHIDIEAAEARGIKVVNAPGQNARAVAEFTFGLLIDITRRIVESFDSVRNGIWNPIGYPGFELKGKTLGVIGIGRIGSRVALLARAFEMKTIACDPYVPEEYAERIGVALVSFDELVSTSDYITLHVPLTDETRQMINADSVKKMKKGVYIVNTARGEVVDEDAIIDGLMNNKIAGYAADVLWGEPPENSRIFRLLREGRLKNTVITSHIAATGAQALENCGVYTANEVIKALGR
jgi:D-3-phosphoglycerate dehydrogenase